MHNNQTIPPYPCQCHGQCCPPPRTSYEVHGHTTSAIFSLISAFPYIVDPLNIYNGNVISVSEQVTTHVAQRYDATGITLDAKFDMTSLIESNTTLNGYIEQIIKNTDAETLKGVLPIIKPVITFKLYYHITDEMNDTVVTSTATVDSYDILIHPTDVKDYFITSAKDILVVNFGAMSYNGLYTMCLDKIEAYASVIDTKQHLEDNLNKYYQFTENNTKIVVDDNIVTSTATDELKLIASCDINYRAPFQANVVTRMKINFIPYMSFVIFTNNTFNVWNELNDTVKEMIEKLTTAVETLSTKLDTFETTTNASIAAINTDITSIKTDITTINTHLTTIDTSISSLDARVTALEHPSVSNET